MIYILSIVDSTILLSIYQLIDLSIKALAFSGFFFTLHKFRVEWRREFIKKVFESKSQFYIQILQITADLISYQLNTAEFLAAEVKFNLLYRGPYLLVTSKAVEECMVDFKKELDHYIANSSQPILKEVLDAKQYKLAHTLRNDLTDVWKIGFSKDNYLDVTKP